MLPNMTQEERTKIREAYKAKVDATLKDPMFGFSLGEIAEAGLSIDKVRVMVATTPQKYKMSVINALKKRLSINKAVTLKCQECCGYEGIPTRITECNSPRCPLWRYRPYQKNQEPIGDCEQSEQE